MFLEGGGGGEGVKGVLFEGDLSQEGRVVVSVWGWHFGFAELGFETDFAVVDHEDVLVCNGSQISVCRVCRGVFKVFFLSFVRCLHCFWVCFQRFAVFFVVHPSFQQSSHHAHISVEVDGEGALEHEEVDDDSLVRFVGTADNPRL